MLFLTAASATATPGARDLSKLHATRPRPKRRRVVMQQIFCYNFADISHSADGRWLLSGRLDTLISRRFHRNCCRGNRATTHPTSPGHHQYAFPHRYRSQHSFGSEMAQRTWIAAFLSRANQVNDTGAAPRLAESTFLAFNLTISRH